jgi:NADPH:quinone reductase-like Zn-dependent oxidoreductase
MSRSTRPRPLPAIAGGRHRQIELPAPDIPEYGLIRWVAGIREAIVMRVWEVDGEWSIDRLRLAERPSPNPGPGEVVVKMRAASLNYRDLLTVEGRGGVKQLPLVPFSDGSGEITAVGSGVSRVKIGDRVCPLFFQSWIDGDLTPKSRAAALGGSAPGVLQEELLLSAEGVAPIPAHLSFVEAATLPCAALTAWRALVTEGAIKAGHTVLVQGTGGVSIFALQFAKIFGAKVVATSSSDEKLTRAKELGADHLINYRSTPAWANAVLALTNDVGADHVVEVGGKDTMAQSIEAAAAGGRIAIIGLLSGLPTQIEALQVFRKNLRVIGISVGSREQFEAMCRAIHEHKLKPVVDRSFPFDKVPDALRLMKSGKHFGKICVEF